MTLYDQIMEVRTITVTKEMWSLIGTDGDVEYMDCILAAGYEAIGTKIEVCEED